ncbi:MAG: hypothetical protein ACPHCI_01585 [Solirubrobacterales bacterium]
MSPTDEEIDDSLRLQAHRAASGVCLFCLRDDGGFTSREHIFSEGVGNHEYVLEPGIVCDRCNNGPLARADEVFYGLPPITLLRAERGLPTKAGKAVVSKWGNAQIAFSAPGTMEVLNPGKGATNRMPEPGSSMNGQSGTMDLVSGGPITAKTIFETCKSIWKSAIELMYWDHGAGAFNPALDDARAAVIAKDGPAWAVLPKESEAAAEVTLQYQPRQIGGRLALPVFVSIFGVQFYTDIARRDLLREEIDPPFEANIWIADEGRGSA